MSKRTFLQVVRTLLIVFFSCTGLTWLYRKVRLRHGPLVRIVAFHDVHDREWFESVVKTLTETFSVISPDAWHDKNFARSGIHVLIAFDDGYKSWMDVALPILQAHGISALFFLNSGLIEVSDNQTAVDEFMRQQLFITPRVALSWNDVKELIHAGHSIGGHGRSHKNLTAISPLEVQSEIATDKRAIEEYASISLVDFAYPFGSARDVNEEAVYAVQRAGYRYGYTTQSMFASGKETYLVPRTCIETGLSMRQLKQWVYGSFDLFVFLKRILLR